MQKDMESEKNGLPFENGAASLKKEQHEHAVDLRTAQTKTAHALQDYNDKSAADLLNSDKEIKETPEESRRYAATNLASTQHKAAAMLKDSQLKAAKALDDSQTKAATALRESHAQADSKHDEKNEVISWLSGGYSHKQ